MYGQTDASIIFHPIRIPCRCNGEQKTYTRRSLRQQEIASW